MASILNADTSNGLKITSDTSGEIKLQSAGTDTVTVTSSGSVGIGTSSPTTTANKNLHISATSGQSSLVRVTGNGATGLDLLQGADSTGYLWLRDNAELLFGTNNASRMRIDPSGRVTIPNQPAFLVGYNTNTNLTVATGNKVTFNQKNFDNNNNFDTTNSRFTAPVTGKYRLAASFQSDCSQNGRPSYRKNGSDFVITTDAVQSTSYITGAGTNQITLILDIVMPLNAGDYVEIWQRTGGGTLAYYAGHSYWNGYLIG